MNKAMISKWFGLVSAPGLLLLVACGCVDGINAMDGADDMDDGAEQRTGALGSRVRDYDLLGYGGGSFDPGVLDPSGGGLTPGDDSFNSNLQHSCSTGSSKNSCASFVEACKKYTGYDATSSPGNVGNAVNFSCSCDGPQIASSSFCDSQVAAANQ